MTKFTDYHLYIWCVRTNKYNQFNEPIYTLATYHYDGEIKTLLMQGSESEVYDWIKGRYPKALRTGLQIKHITIGSMLPVVTRNDDFYPHSM